MGTVGGNKQEVYPLSNCLGLDPTFFLAGGRILLRDPDICGVASGGEGGVTRRRWWATFGRPFLGGSSGTRVPPSRAGELAVAERMANVV